jgi:hypothetical protein
MQRSILPIDADGYLSQLNVHANKISRHCSPLATVCPNTQLDYSGLEIQPDRDGLNVSFMVQNTGPVKRF